MLENSKINIPFNFLANGILIPDDLNKDGLTAESLPKITNRLIDNPFAESAKKKGKKGGKKKGGKKKKKGGKKKKK